MRRALHSWGTTIAFILVVAAVAVGFVHTEQIARRQQGVLSVQKATLEARRVTLREQNRALAEVCRTSNVLLGIVQARAGVDQFYLAHGLVSKVAVSVVSETLTVFRGYQQALSEHAACKEILKP